MPDLFVLSVAIFLAWLFASAGLHKLTNSHYYNDIINNYVPALSFSTMLLNSLRMLLGAGELLLACMILIPVSRSAGLLLAIILLLTYAVAMFGQILSGRKEIACGCAGPAAQTTIGPSLIIRNILLSILTAVVLFLPKQLVLLTMPAMAMACLMAVFLILFYLSSEQMISNAQQFSR